jgi:serine/threonine protein kinase
VKVLADRYAADDDIRRRFWREAQAGARLSGLPHTVMTYDVGEWEGRPFIVMEYLGGGTLADVMRAESPPPERALAWLEQAALSLDSAHALGVVHRDVKPGNLLLDSRGEVHVADFGIATAAGLDSFTQTGTILGTAGYLSPEQAEGRPATAASDRYALAVVAFELLTGSRPFAGESPAAEVAAHAYGAVPSASSRRRSVPRCADPVFASALDKRPERRYPRCTAFVAALRSAYSGAGLAAPASAVAESEQPTAIVRPEPSGRRAGGPLAAVLGAAALLVAAGLFWGSGSAAFPPAGHAAKAPVSSPRALLVRARTLARTGRYSAAVPLLERAVRRTRGSTTATAAAANLALGEALFQLGSCFSALPYLSRASAIQPSNTTAVTALQTAQTCANPPPLHPHPAPHPKPRHDHPKPPKHHDHGHHGPDD